MESEIKPWGSWEVIYEDENCKVKKLTIKPQQKLSLQYHYRRQEHWVCARGIAEVLVNQQTGYLYPSDSVFIPWHAVHQLANPSETENLIIIETQTGEYFGEDDIVRIDDTQNINDPVQSSQETPPAPELGIL
jgi:mannose-6-phosphate isomerase-like protein (cupin superfamily)